MRRLIDNTVESVGEGRVLHAVQHAGSNGYLPFERFPSSLCRNNIRQQVNVAAEVPPPF
jgi:hypothetical protein